MKIISAASLISEKKYVTMDVCIKILCSQDNAAHELRQNRDERRMKSLRQRILNLEIDNMKHLRKENTTTEFKSSLPDYLNLTDLCS